MLSIQGIVVVKDKLTHFQEQFCREYVKTGNASAAYRVASPNAVNWEDHSVWIAASKIMARNKVAIRIAEMQSDAAQSSMVTVDMLNRKLENYQKEAREDKQYAVCVAAVMGQAKLFGFLVDRKEIRTGPLENLDFEQLRLVNDALATLAIAGPVADADTSETAH